MAGLENPYFIKEKLAFRRQLEPDRFAAQLVFAVGSLQDVREVPLGDIHKSVPVEDVDLADGARVDAGLAGDGAHHIIGVNAVNAAQVQLQAHHAFFAVLAFAVFFLFETVRGIRCFGAWIAFFLGRKLAGVHMRRFGRSGQGDLFFRAARHADGSRSDLPKGEGGFISQVG